MKSFATSIAIKARPEKIWALLTDASIYPSLDPAIAKVEGRIGAGERVVVHANGRPFKLQVTTFEPNQRMVWSGGMPLGLFRGIRTYALGAATPGTVEFTMREVFSGLMAPLIVRSIPDLQPSFDTFAANLKRRAESMG
jgi:hypothetical protein